MNKFPERLKELRIEKNLSQGKLGEFLAVDHRTISNWEKGTRQPDFDMLIKIAEVLEETTDYLLGVVD